MTVKHFPTTEHADLKRKYPKWEVPAYRAEAYRQKSNKYACCVFVINEGAKIKKQLKRMKAYAGVVDTIVADGGSTDGSVEGEFLKSVSVRAKLTKEGPGKLSAQMRMALAYCLAEGYEGVVVIDGNGKDDVSAIPQFVRLLEEGYDHIQGSRFIKGGAAINTPLERLIAVHLIHAPLISLAARKRITDTTNGFRAYSRKLLQDKNIGVFRNIFVTYELHYHLAIESARNRKFRTIETPVTRSYPKKGKTPTKISPIKGNLHVLGVLIRAVLGKYKLKQG